MKEEPKPDSFLTSAFRKARDTAREGAKEIGKDVVRDVIDLKHDFIKYGKNRLVSGGAVAFKFALLGTLAGPIGTKTAAVAGFALGFFGGPMVARKLESVLDGVKPSNDNPQSGPAPKADDEPELPFDRPPPPPGPGPK